MVVHNSSAYYTNGLVLCCDCCDWNFYSLIVFCSVQSSNVIFCNFSFLHFIHSVCLHVCVCVCVCVCLCLCLCLCLWVCVCLCLYVDFRDGAYPMPTYQTGVPSYRHLRGVFLLRRSQRGVSFADMSEGCTLGGDLLGVHVCEDLWRVYHDVRLYQRKAFGCLLPWEGRKQRLHNGSGNVGKAVWLSNRMCVKMSWS